MIFWLTLGYLIAYIPYVALVKSLSSGLIPGVGVQSGLVLLPAAAIGQLVVMPVFLMASGWWRYGTRRRILGRRLFFPTRATFVAGLMTAVIVGTTTFNFTFPGVSILLMLLLMRAGTLVLAPLVDVARRRTVHGYAWGAVAFSLVAVALALTDVSRYVLTGGALVSLGAYLIAYLSRFQIMNSVAKTGVKEVDRRYFVGEHATAPVFLVLMLAGGALLGHPALVEGFTGFLRSPAVIPALGIGIAYECLFVFGTLIYLDHNEYSWVVPLNRCASVVAGVVASLGLAALTPQAIPGLPGRGQWLALLAVLCAVVMLCYPAIRRLLDGGAQPVRQRLLLFVCGGNTCRSPMAEALAKEEIAIARAGATLSAASAGVAVKTVGAPMTTEAVVALGEMGIEVRHRTRRLTPEICRQANVIYCMTRSQRDAVLAMAPDVENRLFCLDQGTDIPDPIGQPLEVYREFAGNLRSLVRSRMAELPGYSQAGG